MAFVYIDNRWVSAIFVLLHKNLKMHRSRIEGEEGSEIPSITNILKIPFESPMKFRVTVLQIISSLSLVGVHFPISIAINKESVNLRNKNMMRL